VVEVLALELNVNNTREGLLFQDFVIYTFVLTFHQLSDVNLVGVPSVATFFHLNYFESRCCSYPTLTESYEMTQTRSLFEMTHFISGSDRNDVMACNHIRESYSIAEEW